MWFLPFSVAVMDHGIAIRGYELWFIRFIKKLLQGDRAVIRLLKETPFADEPPRYVRARFYHYQFTSKAEFKETGNTWTRTFIDDYVPPHKR